MRGLKTSFSLVVFLLTIATINIFGQIKDVMAEDGVWWEKMSELSKLSYLAGFISGTGAAEGAMSYWKHFLEDEEYQKMCEKEWDRIALRGITVGQLKDGIDKLYDDFSNRRIKIVDAVFVVDMQIRGKNPELIAGQIRYLKCSQ